MITANTPLQAFHIKKKKYQIPFLFSSIAPELGVAGLLLPNQITFYAWALLSGKVRWSFCCTEQQLGLEHAKCFIGAIFDVTIIMPILQMGKTEAPPSECIAEARF